MADEAINLTEVEAVADTILAAVPQAYKTAGWAKILVWRAKNPVVFSAFEGLLKLHLNQLPYMTVAPLVLGPNPFASETPDLATVQAAAVTATA
jgi:hypothetical protein